MKLLKTKELIVKIKKIKRWGIFCSNKTGAVFMKKQKKGEYVDYEELMELIEGENK